MKQHIHKQLVIAAALTACAIVFGIATLWSWNTIAELVGGPRAQFKHLLAAAILLLALRCTVTFHPWRDRQRRGHAPVSGK